MTITEIKNNFHNLIDDVDNEELLSYFYNAFYYSSQNKILSDLSESEKREILKAYQESEDESELIEHDKVKEKYKKWL
jgi:hypothetical protein